MPNSSVVLYFPLFIYKLCLKNGKSRTQKSIFIQAFGYYIIAFLTKLFKKDLWDEEAFLKKSYVKPRSYAHMNRHTRTQFIFYL